MAGDFELVILSAREIAKMPGWQPIYDFEDLFARVTGATLVAPLPWGPAARRIVRGPVRKLLGSFQRSPLALRGTGRRVLFVSAVNPFYLELAASLEEWRDRFDKVIAYVIDSYPLNMYTEIAGSYDHILVPILENVEPVRALAKVPASLLPMAADVLLEGSDAPGRGIDLVGYGRQPPQFARMFFDAFGKPGSPFLYLCSGMYLSFEASLHENRAYLLSILRRSRAALSFDTAYHYFRPDRGKIEGVSIVVPRYFECMAAGCAVVGKRPVTPLADTLFDWEDAFIDLPDGEEGALDAVSGLLGDRGRLDAIRRRNFRQSLARHDWRYRILEILKLLGLGVPPLLDRELGQLQERLKACGQED
jgi:hypothetical protein